MKRFNCKKMLAVFLSVLLLTGLMATSAMGVSAAPVAYTDIEADETLTVTLTVSQSTKYLRFIPEEDGEYIFYSTGYMDTYGVLLDADEEILYSDDDSGEDYNFNIRYFLYAGNVYYLSLSIYGDGTGIFDVTAEAADVGFEVDAVLTVDEGITATNIPVDEPSYFSFTPEWSGWYTMYTTGDADTYGKLVDSEGNWYIFNDNTVDEDNFSITYYFEEGITYYLIVWGYGGWTVNYDLYVDAVSVYDLFVGAEIIEVDETWTCTAASDGDHLYFRFMPEVSGEYSFTAAGDADPYCYFYDADYGEVYYVDDTDELGVNFTFTYDYEAGCPYYFMLGDWNAETSFTVTLESVSEETESIEIATGETVEVTADTSYAYQEFYFYPEEDGWYEFVSYGSCDTMVTVYTNPSVKDHGHGVDLNYRAVAYCYAGEEYTFDTLVFDEYGGTYQVTVNAIEEDVLFPDATTIEVGDTAEVTWDGENDAPVYRFTPAVSGTYSFYTTGDEDTYCYLYDLEYTQYDGWDDYYFAKNYNCVITTELTAGKTYYFVLSAYLSGGEPASSRVYLQEGEYTDPKAYEIQLGVTQTVYPDNPETSYYYAFVPEESGWYRADMTVDGFLSVTWYDAYGNYILDESNGSAADDFSVSTYLRGGEEYYLELSTYGEDVPMYTVTINAVDDDDVFLDATDIHSEQTVAVEGEQVFRFVPTVTGAYTFYSTGSWDTYCKLYDVTAGGTEHYDDALDDVNFSFTHTFMAGQTYYFYVDSYGDDLDPYSVTLLFEQETAVVDHITIGGLRAPEVGETVADYYESLNELITDPELTLDDAAVLMGNYFMEDSEIFEVDCTYTVGLAFGEIENGVIFANGYTVTTNVGESVEVEYFDGYAIIWVNITVSEDEPDVLLGDVDGNGRVNNRDLGLLQQYLNDWNVSVDLAVCDMDGNGRVNNRDLGQLQQLLNA